MGGFEMYLGGRINRTSYWIWMKVERRGTKNYSSVLTCGTKRCQTKWELRENRFWDPNFYIGYIHLN